MLDLRTETVTIDRTGAQLAAYIDPNARTIYCVDSSADVVGGDVAFFRSLARRISKVPEVWFDGGIVLEFEAHPPLLPDLGTVTRGGGTWVFNDTTGERVLTPGATVWSGPCHVENDPYGFDRLADLGEQYVSTVPFIIRVPLDTVDVKDGDIFTVISSRDPRLGTRPLIVKSVRAGSDNLFREVLAFDNQGD